MPLKGPIRIKPIFQHTLRRKQDKAFVPVNKEENSAPLSAHHGSIMAKQSRHDANVHTPFRMPEAACTSCRPPAPGTVLNHIASRVRELPFVAIEK